MCLHLATLTERSEYKWSLTLLRFCRLFAFPFFSRVLESVSLLTVIRSQPTWANGIFFSILSGRYVLGWFLATSQWIASKMHLFSSVPTCFHHPAPIYSRHVWHRVISPFVHLASAAHAIQTNIHGMLQLVVSPRGFRVLRWHNPS